MSFFADDEFSFLETYQEDRSNGEDESDNERSQMSSKEDDDFSILEVNDEEEDSDNEDVGVEGLWDELMASFGELDKCDEGTCEEGSGCDFDFVGESTSTKEEESDDEEEILSEGDVSPHTNTTDPSGEVNNNAAPRRTFSVDKVLRDGLIFAGFNDERITRCGEKRNTDRFKAHYGVGPKTVVSFLEDLFNKHPSLKYKDVFMTLNWLKTYSVAHVMAAIWGPCEEYINPVLEDYIAKFASLKEGKIRLDRFNDETIIVFSIDACHFMVDEMALDPSTRWYDFKKGGAGLKYEVALSIHTNEIMWIRGPLEASIHDISMFRGYTTKDKKKNKVDKDAFINYVPAGKKGVGDSGYSGEPNKIVTTRKGQSVEMKRWLGRVKSRQETFFSRMKSFNIMKNRFRHGKRGTKDKMIRHKNCFESVVVLLAYDIEHNPLFEV
mmetsp:Transcript_12008/g.19841  ORF Transcript_12008/g.19841 Transcript_12008/m.19841 type:complete len:438 (-) Transcript_12008:41-1354(-)